MTSGMPSPQSSAGVPGEAVWGPPPDRLELAGDEVHVWCISLDQPVALHDQLAAALSPDEQERAGRFHFERDRRRFAVGRGILRQLLAGYLSAEPHRLAFSYGECGKPALAAPWDSAGLCFNLSHSQGLALAAFAWRRELGIDVEQVRDTSDGDGIVRRFFSPAEVAIYFSLPPGDRQEAFFRCWTRKEAYLKASGEGFTCPLDSFDVTLAPGEAPRLLRVADDPAEVARWHFSHLEPAPGYLGALAIEGPNCRPRCWQWKQTERMKAEG